MGGGTSVTILIMLVVWPYLIMYCSQSSCVSVMATQDLVHEVSVVMMADLQS